MKGSSRERACFAFVLLVWLECLVATQVFIAGCASRIPLADDGALFFNRAIGLRYWEYVWSQHNEHRLPLPKLLQTLLYDWTGDIRSGMFLQAQVYAAVALACILAARSLRGGSRPWDVFFPLMWLQLGNSVNLMMGFQLGVAIPGACVSTLLLCGVLSERRLQPSHALASGLALIALPLSGGAGLLQMPLLAAYSGWLGFTQRGNPEARERRGARIHAVCALVAIAVGGLHLLGYRWPSQEQFAAGVHPRWKLVLATLCAPFGPDFCDWRPLLMPAVALVALGLVIVFARRGVAARDPRTLGTLAVLACGALLVGVIAFGRQGDGPVLVANRYIPLPAPFFVALTLGGLVLLPRRWRELALASSCVLMLICLPGSIRYGIQDGRTRIRMERELDALVETRAEWSRVQQHFDDNYDPGSAEIGRRLLRTYAKHGLPPFDRNPAYVLQAREYLMFDTRPERVLCSAEPVDRVLDGELVCCVEPPTTLEFAVAPVNESFSCSVGVPELLLRSGRHPGVRALVRLAGRGEEARTIGTIELDPRQLATQRGLQRFEFSWPAGTSGTLQLVFERLPMPEGTAAADRVALRDARVR